MTETRGRIAEISTEIQKPLATLIVDGIIIGMLLSFTVLPHIFCLAFRRDKRVTDNNAKIGRKHGDNLLNQQELRLLPEQQQ